jgi:peptidoglycan/xylan/chitin deacetylase (PgdA/CDA1 family)
MMIKQTLFILAIITQISFAQNYGALRITNYADDKKGAFCFTFDDGLKSQFDYAKPILDQYGFKGTFYVLPPYLAEENGQTIWRYGTWPEFQTLASEGHEIGSHTLHHLDLTSIPWGNIYKDSTLLYELYWSKDSIDQRIPNSKCISFNYPYTTHNSVVDSATKMYYENGRALGQTPNNSNLYGNEWYGLNADIVSFSLPRLSLDDDLDELYSFIDSTQNSIDNKKWGMIIIHDVVPFKQIDSLLNLPEEDGPPYEPVSTEWLTWLCEFLSSRSLNNDVWVETVGNITRYIKERENSSYQIMSSISSSIEINLTTDNLDNTIYNYPLSAYVNIPDDWNYVRTEQNGKVDTLTTTLTDSGRVVLSKVSPNNGILKITPITPTTDNNEIANLAEFQLDQNFPNPFNPSTIIRYKIGKREFVLLKIYDVLGNEVVTLVNAEQAPGEYEVRFSSSIVNLNLANGIYFYRLQAGSYVQTRKMILLK